MTEKFLNKEVHWRVCQDCFTAMYNGQKPSAWADVSINKLVITPDDVLTACSSCLKTFSSRSYHYAVQGVTADPDVEAPTGLRRLHPRYIHLFREENTISIDT